MGKYLSKHDLEAGTKLKIINQIDTSYGRLNIGEIVTLLKVTHFPTTYSVEDVEGRTWLLRTYDVEINS